MDRTKLKKSKVTLTSILGAAAVAVVVNFTVQLEGDIPQAYYDLAGVPTICSGVTEGITAQDVLDGLFLNDEECQTLLENELVKHAQAVARCTPEIIGHPYQSAAAVAFSYNIGTAGYCRSTAAKKFKQGKEHWREACEAFGMWNKVNGKVVKGLVNRRNAEIKMCLRDLPKE